MHQNFQAFNESSFKERQLWIWLHTENQVFVLLQENLNELLIRISNEPTQILRVAIEFSKVAALRIAAEEIAIQFNRNIAKTNEILEWQDLPTIQNKRILLSVKPCSIDHFLKRIKVPV